MPSRAQLFAEAIQAHPELAIGEIATRLWARGFYQASKIDGVGKMDSKKAAMLVVESTLDYLNEEIDSLD